MMWNDLIGGIEQLKGFILTAAAGVLIMGGYLLFRCRSFDWEKRNRKLMGFFYGMSWPQGIVLAGGWLKFLLFLWVLLSGGHVETVHIMVFILLELLFLGGRGTREGLLTDCVMGGVSAGALVVIDLLYHYLHEITMDGRIFCVVLLMGVLLCINALGDIFRSCNYIMTGKGKKKHEEAGKNIRHNQGK